MHSIPLLRRSGRATAARHGSYRCRVSSLQFVGSCFHLVDHHAQRIGQRGSRGTGDLAQASGAGPQTLDFLTPRHVRLDGLQGRQSDDDDEDQRGPGECRIGGSHQGPTIHGAPQPSFGMKYHGGIVPGLG